MTAEDKDPLLQAIRRAAASLPEARAAFLFGSHAGGRARADSGIDVAILLDADVPPRDRRTRLKRVLGALASGLAADPP